ncbi:MAG: metallophosphoesterase [Candidatus Sericytochromatia bacterium]
MKRTRLLSFVTLAACLAACQSNDVLVDPTLPGGFDEPDAPATLAPGTSGTPRPSASPSGSPGAGASPKASPSGSVKPSAPASGEPDEVDEDDGPADNIVRLTAPASHAGEAAVHVSLSLPLFSELPSARPLGQVKVVLKRDGVLLNSTVATAEVAGDRIVDGVASVQVEKCEAGAYILQVETQDDAGRGLGAAQLQFKLEQGGVRAITSRMAYVFEGANTSLNVKLEETPAVYVQAGTPDGMSVLWASAASVTSKVVLNDDKGVYVTNKTGAAGRRHQLRFTGLKAGTPYQYVAYEGTTEVARGTFKTARATDGAEFRFAAFGDSGRGTSAQFAVSRQLSAWKPELVLHTGDVVYPSGEASSYGPFFVQPYRELIAGTVFYPTLGNHDYRTDKGQPYLDFFEAPRPNAEDTERYYTFKHGNVQFFALDTNQSYAAGSVQHQWLDAQLAASTATWKVPFFHHPPYSSGDHGSSTGVRAAFGPLFEKHKVQLVLTGHDHHYERTKPQNGVVYVVTGGGGADLRGVKPQAFTAIGQSKHHFVGLTSKGKSLIIEAIDDRGSAFDSTTLTTP